MDYPEVYAVDFDRTLNLAQKYPELRKPNMKLIEMLIGCREAGDKVILWTCREGQLLDDAVEYCRKYGLEFDAINDNIQENKDRWGNNTRKVFADFYIDDRNMLFDGEELKVALSHPVRYGQGIAPYCPRCRSGEYLHNEDGNQNNFCGQCGCPLDWSEMYNEDAERIEEKFKCGDCAEYCRSANKETQGVCKAKGVLIRRSKPACKKYFRKAIHIWGRKGGWRWKD